MAHERKYWYVAIAVAYGLLLVWLSSVWYSSYTTFHFFDDVFEWAYLDKCGHFFASFQLGLLFYKISDTKGLPNSSFSKRWICFSGFFLLLPIEILDGFSLNYGASPADLLANGMGSIFCFLYVSNKTVSCISPKFSFHVTPFSLLRPELLGSNFLQEVVKDYNGQTYWLSFDLNAMTGKSILPSWLLLTIGYGAEGLLGGHDNVWQNAEGGVADYSVVARTKRVFISVDINAAVLRKKSRLFSYLFAPFVLIKFPAPAIELNFDRGIIFHPVYF
ncbi:MAG: DUF2279 domain-containing protein [Bacteroidetes bacterium]|nr:DUF2279 domain-containing protein [Bacteroidota bacterium]